MTGNKWSGAYWGDLAERVGSTLVYALITLLPTAQLADLDAQLAWTILGVPTVLALLKGLAANMASPESGASLIKTPPGPVIEDAAGRDEVGGGGLPPA